MYRNFTGLRSEYMTPDADDIADIPFLEALIVSFFSDVVALYVYLYLALVVHYVGESGFAHDATGDYPSRDRHRIADVLTFGRVLEVFFYVILNIEV